MGTVLQIRGELLQLLCYHYFGITNCWPLLVLLKDYMENSAATSIYCEVPAYTACWYVLVVPFVASAVYQMAAKNLNDH